MNDSEVPDEVEVYVDPQTSEPVVVPYDEAYKASRPYRAHEKHLGGMTWDLIAAEEGYTSAAAAMRDVAAWRDHGMVLVSDFKRAEAIQLAHARYEAILRSVWPAAMKGSLAAAKLASDMVTNEMKLLDYIKEDGSQDAEGRTVVILDPAQAKQLVEQAEA